jgi:hypothetical protein
MRLLFLIYVKTLKKFLVLLLNLLNFDKDQENKNKFRESFVILNAVSYTFQKF